MLGARTEVLIEVAGPQRWTHALVRTSNHSLRALISDMTFKLSNMDVLTCALVDTFESGSFEHLIDHGVELVERVEPSLTVAAFFGGICPYAVSTYDFVTADTVAGIHRDVVAIGAGCASEHGVGPRVQLSQLGLHLSH